MRLRLAWLVALTASHALTWGGAAHAGHGWLDRTLEPHWSAVSFDHGHGDCALVRVDAVVSAGAVYLRQPLFQIEGWTLSAVRVVPRSSERWPHSQAPPV